MDEIFDKLLHKARVKLHSATALVKEKIYAITGTSSATIIQLAEFIKKHSDTTMTKKELLGQTFYFYQLNQDGIQYYLECKNSYILQLDVHSRGQLLVSYRSYRDHYWLNTPIKFPDLKAEY